MKLKLPVFTKRGLTWAVLWYDHSRGEGYAVSEKGDRAELYLRREEYEKLEVRVFRLVDA